MRFSKESFENMKARRGLDFLKRGMSVEIAGRRGNITGNYGHNLLVRFDGDRHSCNCHPHWRAKYFTAKGELIKEYKD